MSSEDRASGDSDGAAERDGGAAGRDDGAARPDGGGEQAPDSDGPTAESAADARGYVHGEDGLPGEGGDGGAGASADDPATASPDGAAAAGEDGPAEMGREGWALVGVVVLCTLVIPGVIYLYPPLLADRVPFLVAMLALPFVPAVLLGATAVWTMTERSD